MRWLLTCALLAMLAAAPVACGDGTGGAVETGKGPVRVATSISVFADMVHRVGGDRVTVISLIPPGADAHTYQPAPKDVRKLTDVRAVFLNGGGLEESIGDLLKNNVPRDARMVELAAGLQALIFKPEAVGPESVAGDEEKEEHEEDNPHFWLDVANAKRYIERIRDTLSEIDAEGSAVYAANAQHYLKELDELDAYIRSRIETIPPAQRKLVTFHDAFPYFANAYGLDLAGYVVRAPGREPSAQDIKQLSEILRAQNVKTVYKEPQLNAKLLERAAKDAGVKVDVLYSDALTKDIKTYIDMMRRNADNLANGLR